MGLGGFTVGIAVSNDASCYCRGRHEKVSLRGVRSSERSQIRSDSGVARVCTRASRRRQWGSGARSCPQPGRNSYVTSVKQALLQLLPRSQDRHEVWVAHASQAPQGERRVLSSTAQTRPSTCLIDCSTSLHQDRTRCSRVARRAMVAAPTRSAKSRIAIRSRRF